MNEVFFGQLREILNSDQCYIQEAMGGHTTFQVGGPAEYYVRPKGARYNQCFLCVSSLGFRGW